jgi:predicted amidophosphoribosyltransferase
VYKIFCLSCDQKIKELIISNNQAAKSFTMFRNEEPLHSLLISAKHPNSSNYLIYKVLIKKYLNLLELPKCVTHVTWVPSKDHHKKHAKAIAKTLSKLHNLKLCNLIKNESLSEAKHLSSLERQTQLAFSLRKNSQCASQFNNLLIVDDIQTSGNTFLKIVELFDANVYTFALARTYLK